MRTRLILTVVLASFAVSVGAYYELHHGGSPVRFETARLTRGDIVANVVATGTLQAVKTVAVSTQANGIVKELDVDFNSVVHKGEVVARLDPTLIQAQIDQGRANVERAKTDVERLHVPADDGHRQLTRARELFARAVLDQDDLDTATAAAEQADADLKAAEANVAQAQAQVDANLINLDHTVITSPIDGIVIARNVDIGQTVVSNMQAQNLFQIAEDLSKMQLQAVVDESDMGRVREGDPVTFTVDAYPADTFNGTVSQVRVNPNIDQNVVTYTTIIDVPNPTLKLRPGMTANLAMRVDSRADVVRLPSSALRFKPNDELFTTLHQQIPKAATASPDGKGSQSAATASTLKASSPSHAPALDHGQVWVFRGGQLRPVPVQLGLSDGTNTELIAGSLQPGDAVVMNVIAANGQ